MLTTEVDAEKQIKEAMNLRYQGKYPEALSKLDELIETLADVDEVWVVFKTGEASHQMAVTFQNMGKFSMAIRLLCLTLNLRKGINDLTGIAYTAFQIPMCRLARGDKKEDILPDFEKAEKAIKEVLPKCDVKTRGDMYQNLAFITQQKGEVNQALKLYAKTLNYRKKANDKRGEGLTRARASECCLEIGEIGLAEINADVAMQIFKEIGDVNRIKQVEAVLAKIQEKEKNR